MKSTQPHRVHVDGLPFPSPATSSVEKANVGSLRSGRVLSGATMESENEGNTYNGDDGVTDSLTPSEEPGPHRTPFYDYANERFDSHADAKLIYQRHRLESETKATSPFMLAKSATLPVLIDHDNVGLSRTASMTSRASNRSHGPKHATAPSQSPQTKQEPFPSLDTRDPFLAADEKARSHSKYPGLPHENKDSLLAEQGFHGAGAGMGIGSGAGGFASNESSIVSEVEAICKKIKELLDMRQKFLEVSLQCPGDNPKDDESWEIYPPPPEPFWAQEKDDSTQNEPKTPLSPSRKRRKPGEAIGEDFDLSQVDIPGLARFDFGLDDESVFQVYEKSKQAAATTKPTAAGGGHNKIPGQKLPIVSVPNLRNYYIHLDAVHDIASDGPAKSFAYRRLQYLEGRYNLYTLLNEYEEVADTKKVPHRDFYNVRKVDTHVHHSACMNQKHLLRFIKSKMKKSPNEVVLYRDGKELTLKQVFESINLTAYDLSIDTLDMHAHTDSFHRFDKFNLKYNPIGQSRLREIFLKTDNYIKGRYLADITRQVISDLESSKYQMVEWRISIYGRSMEEWDKLAAWVIDNKLISHNVRWLIQVPRLYTMYKASNIVNSFEDVIRNLFQPLFEVTQNPQSHPKLHIFLHRVIGFDSVDDESKVERRLFRKYPTPREWNNKQNPPYSYWIYYLFANMASLNAFRKRRRFNTFLLRPHCGEAGDTDHLAAAMLCCHSISHGITLRKVPILQYIFYLDQIGIAMSPLSNNALFLSYDRNPFVSYFRKGMNVSLSTDDPLQFAFTKEPLIEEYSVAAQIYKFSAVDMCELAKHSVDQSGFELALKQRWLGKQCYLPGVLGNDVAKCNVPDVREAFRHETLVAEHTFLAKYTKDYTHLTRSHPIRVDEHEQELETVSEEALSSPRQFFAIAKEATASQVPRNRTATIRSSGDFERLPNASPTDRKPSISSTMLASAAEHGGYVHMPGVREPRMFPGVMHEQARRDGTRRSTVGSDVVEANLLAPALSKMASQEQQAVDEASDEYD